MKGAGAGPQSCVLVGCEQSSHRKAVRLGALCNPPGASCQEGPNPAQQQNDILSHPPLIPTRWVEALQLEERRAGCSCSHRWVLSLFPSMV